MKKSVVKSYCVILFADSLKQVKLINDTRRQVIFRMEGVVAIYRKYIEYRSSDIQTIFYFLMSGALSSVIIHQAMNL